MRPRDTDRRLHGMLPPEDVERELAFHLEMRERELVEAGWEASAARQEARRLFGDYASIRAACGAVAARHARSKGRGRMVGELMQDVRYAVRWLGREKGFALLAVLTLALGIGANSAAFALVSGVLLRPLPYPDPGRLVAVWEVTDGGYEAPLSWPNFDDWRRAGLRTVSGLAAYQQPFRVTVVGGAEGVRAAVSRVSGEYFGVLGVAPLVGRTWVADELVMGGRAAVVVSESYWRGPLGAERDLGKLHVELFGQSAAVVGVMPAAFDAPRGSDIWYPLEAVSDGLGGRDAHNYAGVARLAAGASLSDARAELSTLAAAVHAREPDSDALSVALRPLREASVAGSERTLLILLGASACVLLVACTNLASALLARATRRRRELAVRAALGGSRARLVRQLLTESLLLAGLGAAAGLLLAGLLLDTLRAIGPEALPRLAEVSLDWRVLAFTATIALLTGVVFGTVPALRATQDGAFGATRSGLRATGSAGQRRAWGALIGAEVALALLLLVACGLLIRSFWNVINVDPGLNADNVLVVDVDLPAARYPDGAARTLYYDELLRRVARLGGVESAAVTMALPLTGWDPFGSFQVEGSGPGQAHYRVVSPGFFDALRIELRAGRLFDARDRAGAADVVVINAALAARYFPGENPIGRRISTGGMDTRQGVLATIVGVVADVRHHDLTTGAAPGYYLPYMQRPDRIAHATLLVRAERHSPGLHAALRASVRTLDGQVPVEVGTMRGRVGEGLADRRLAVYLLGGFAAVALLLAAIGIYSVVAFAVAQRTREIGIRSALGAGAASVVWAVSRGTLISVAIGLVAGVLLAVALARLLAGLLFEIEPVDPLTFAGVTAVLLLTAWLATLVPARRALRVDPTVALRAE